MSNASLPFFINPFCLNGTAAAVPVTAGATGTMSYNYGFTTNYSQDLLTNPTALPIPRDQMNQLFLDITAAIQQYQIYGIPAWITSADNGGSSFTGYPIYAQVYYMGDVYQCQLAGNTSTPGTDANWLLLSGSGSNTVQAGTIVDFPTPITPAGYLSCDGSSVLRTTYASLFNAITQIQTGTTINTMTSLTGLTNATTQMWVNMPIEGAGIQAGTTIASITNDTTIVMSQTATASASVPVRFYYWGAGDGSTTFNVPLLNAKVRAGHGTSLAGIGSIEGQSNTIQSVTLTGNNMPSGTPECSTPVINATVAFGGFYNCPGNLSGGNGFTDGIATPFNIIQPTAIVNTCIKI